MYERFFGLGDTPFRLTPDPHYLFLSSKHAEALAHLRLGLKESSGFVCITGDVGTGKTTLLRAFLAELGPEVTAAYIISPALSTLELLQRINREFGLPGTSTSQMELVDTLNAHLLAQHQAGRVSVVVVDEAQAFSMDLLEQLRLLSNLETATEKLLRVVLVGQPQLRTLLLDPAMAQLNQRITLRWHMGPLRYRETVAYVRHRLAVASEGRAARLFTVPALRLTHSLADGVPRLINMIAHRATLAAFVARQPRVTRRSVVRAYREIKAVPLPGTLSVVRRAAWGAAGVAVGVGVVTLGVPLGWFTDIRRPPALRPAEVVAKTAPVAPSAEAPPAEPAPAVAEPAPAAPAATAAPEPVPAVPLRSPVAELERRLTALDAQASGRAAAEAVLAAWHTRSLADDIGRILEGSRERERRAHRMAARPRGHAAHRQPHRARHPGPPRATRAPCPGRERTLLRSAHRSGRAPSDAHDRSHHDHDRRRPPRPLLVRRGTRPVARLRGARDDVRPRRTRGPRCPPAGVAPTSRPVCW